MRNLFGQRENRVGDTPAAAPRPDALRRTTLRTNARLLLAAGAAAMPLALFGLLHGAPLALVLAAIGLVTGMATLALGQRGRTDAAADGQVYGILLAGVILAVADPAIADFGLAVALLGPIHASLLTGAAMKRRAWVLLAGVLAISVGAALASAGQPVAQDPALRIAGGLSFAVLAAIVAFTANRLNTAFEVYDRGQINAYRHLLEHVQDAVMRFSIEGELLFSSRSSEALFGCKRYELTGSGLVERLHVLDRPLFMTAFADANHGGLSRSIEVRMRRDGEAAAHVPSFIWVEIALSPVVDAAAAAGARHEVVALFRDITSRRDQETAMRAARQAAEDASEAKSRFLATISHELRTPLNAIIGFSEMMSSNIGGELSPTHREYAELIHNSGTHLIGVVGMLLDMSRLEAGKFELYPDSFLPEVLLEPCLRMVEPLARAKGVRLELDRTPGLPGIIADERACRQILINLLSNAIKFSLEGGTVSVAMKRQGTFLALAVTDHGIGMSPAAIERIGEPFFQANEGLARRYEGTGLGLSIVRGLVELHDGELRVTSEAGHGTVVTVLLPINGPETKMPQTGSVTPLRREGGAPLKIAPWPEQKRSAK